MAAEFWSANHVSAPPAPTFTAPSVHDLPAGTVGAAPAPTPRQSLSGVEALDRRDLEDGKLVLDSGLNAGAELDVLGLRTGHGDLVIDVARVIGGEGRETRLDRQDKKLEGTTPQLTGKYTPAPK